MLYKYLTYLLAQPDQRGRLGRARPVQFLSFSCSFRPKISPNTVLGSVADLGGTPPACAPLRPKIFLISCSFSENLTKLYVGAPQPPFPPPEGRRPLLQGILDPPLRFLLQTKKLIGQFTEMTTTEIDQNSWIESSKKKIRIFFMTDKKNIV